LRDFSAARKDLESYLQRSPEATDRNEVVRQLQTIHRWLGRLN